MENWVEIADESAISNDSAQECVADSRIIALFRIDDEFFAIDGICPHQGGSLAQGTLHGCIVSCPWHGWKFDVTDGAYQSSDSMFQRTYPVKVEHGKVLVNIAEKLDNPDPESPD